MTDQPTDPTADEQTRLRALVQKHLAAIDAEPARLKQQQREWLATHQALVDRMKTKATAIQAAIAAGHIPPALPDDIIDQAKISAARVLVTEAQFKYFEAYRDYQQSGRIPAQTPKERGAKGAAVRKAKRRLDAAESALQEAAERLEQVLQGFNE